MADRLYQNFIKDAANTVSLRFIDAADESTVLTNAANLNEMLVYVGKFGTTAATQIATGTMTLLNHTGFPVGGISQLTIPSSAFDTSGNTEVEVSGTVSGTAFLTLAVAGQTQALTTKIETFLDTTVSSRAAETSLSSGVAQLETKIDLQATSAALTALEAKVDIVGANVDNTETLASGTYGIVNSGSFGNSAIKTVVDTIDGNVDQAISTTQTNITNAITSSEGTITAGITSGTNATASNITTSQGVITGAISTTESNITIAISTSEGVITAGITSGVNTTATNISTAEANIRGTDSDDLKIISEQIDLQATATALSTHDTDIKAGVTSGTSTTATNISNSETTITTAISTSEGVVTAGITSGVGATATNISTAEANIRGADSDDLQTISIQIDGVVTDIGTGGSGTVVSRLDEISAEVGTGSGSVLDAKISKVLREVSGVSVTPTA